MAKDRDRAPPPTEVLADETKRQPRACDPSSGESPKDDTSSPFEGAELVGLDEKLAIGQRLSERYRIERVLGEGGMSVVYLASDEQVVGEVFAIKVLKGTFDADALELLRQEVRKTRKLSHPNIVDVHSVNVDGNKLYMLMECLEGKPLRALLNEEFGRGMPFSHAWPIIKDVAAALGYAHDHNIIHADLKPENIFVTTSGKAKLLDFGIARLSRRSSSRQATGARVLTPAYASCEMLQGKEADRRDDVYAFACVIFEMLCGEMPFGERTSLEARTVGARVPPLGLLSRPQNAALAHALAFDRESRTASVERFVAGLADVRVAGGRRTAGLGLAILALVGALGLAYWAADRLGFSRRAVVVQSVVPAKSIAVLPFLDLSKGHEQQYVADGLTTAVIDRLTMFPGLSVTAQTSSFAVKDSQEDAPTLARRLRVAYLLEGTLRGSPEQLHVSVRLIRADGFELSLQVFDRSGSEILKLQEEIARAVAGDLHASLGEAEPPAGPSTRSLEAFRLMLQARHQAVGTEDERALIEAALQRDPGYADAWAELGLWWYDAMLLGTVAPQTAAPKARSAFERALALDPNSSHAYRGLAWLQMSELDWPGAQRSVARAAALDPANVSVLTLRGELARSAGRWGEAVRLEREHLERDPLSVGAKFVLAQSALCAGEYDTAEQLIRQAIAENPRYPEAHALLARALVALGHEPSAMEALTAEPDESARLAGLASVETAAGGRDTPSEAINQLRTRYGGTLPGLIGLAYAYRGELEQAFPWLQRAVEQHQPEFAASLACTPEPAFGSLRADPRFAALRHSLGFER